MPTENSHSVQSGAPQQHHLAISRLREWMGKRVASARQVVAFPAIPTIDDPSSTWFAGMVIDPTDFGQQLSLLQVALHHAGKPVGERVRVSGKG